MAATAVETSVLTLGVVIQKFLTVLVVTVFVSLVLAALVVKLVVYEQQY